MHARDLFVLLPLAPTLVSCQPSKQITFRLGLLLKNLAHSISFLEACNHVIIGGRFKLVKNQGLQ